MTRSIAVIGAGQAGLQLGIGLLEKVSAKAQMIDDLAWSPGALSCVVRHPVAPLPSGRAVFGLGDAVTVFDPVSAQGANNAAKMAHGLTRASAEASRWTPPG